MDQKESSLGLWAVTAPPPPPLSVFTGEKNCDVAVIGGGFTGTSAALHLAEKGADAVLLEAQTIGHGGSGRNVGLVNAGLWVLPDDVVKALGPEYGERLNTALGNSPSLVFDIIEKHAIQCEALHNGTLHCAHSPAGYRYLKEREAQWGRRGAPVQVLDSNTAASKIGSNAFHGALLDQRAGTVQPLAYVYGLANAAVKAGAKLHTGSPVTGLTRSGDKWQLTTPSGRLTANAVIVATNAYLDHIFDELKQTFIPFNYFQFSTPPLPKEVLDTVLPGKHGTWDTNTVLSSFRLDQAGRLIVGSVGRTDGFAWGLHRNWAERMVRGVFPQIGTVQMEHGWHGVIAMTTNHIPRFHILGPDLVMITSYNGRGIGPGTVCGKILADYLTGGTEKDIPLPVSKPAPIFLHKVHELFYETGARMYHLLQRRLL
jgi:glycine/D-amino acid oxidase-like deaminating enzyme